jgi:hypothetical protein
MSDEYSSVEGDDGRIDGGNAVDPGSVTGEPAEPALTATGRKRRADFGKPRGPRGTRSAKKEKIQVSTLDLSGLTAMFVGAHLMLSQATRTPEIAITDDEGKHFMDAAKNVMRHYSVESTQKTLDWIAFVGVGFEIYGTRAIAISVRHRTEKGKPIPLRPHLVVGDQSLQPPVFGGEEFDAYVT